MNNKIICVCPKCNNTNVHELPEGQCVVEIKKASTDYIGGNDCYPTGKEMVVNHIKEIGKRLIENAEMIWDNEIADERVTEIEFTGRIAVNEITELEIRKVINIMGVE